MHIPAVRLRPLDELAEPGADAGVLEHPGDDLLERRGAIVSYSDHFVPSMPAEHGHKPRTEVPFAKAIADGFDIAVITTNHKTFDYDTLVAKAPLILDTRNALKGRPGAHIFRL